MLLVRADGQMGLTLVRPSIGNRSRRGRVRKVRGFPRGAEAQVDAFTVHELTIRQLRPSVRTGQSDSAWSDPSNSCCSLALTLGLQF